VDVVILKKIDSSILNGLGYIGRLEKKNGSKYKKSKTRLKSIVLRPLKVQPGHIWVKKFKRIIRGMFPSGLEK